MKKVLLVVICSSMLFVSGCGSKQPVTEDPGYLGTMSNQYKNAQETIDEVNDQTQRDIDTADSIMGEE